MADPMEAGGQDMDQEPADELVRVEPHHFHPFTAFDPVVFPSEGHSVGVAADKAVVRYNLIGRRYLNKFLLTWNTSSQIK